MASGVHKVDISGGRRPSGTVANVVFDNSRKLNSLNPPALLDLTEAFLGLAREDDLRVVVLSGAGGKAFIGGADINHMAGMKSSEDGRAFITSVHKLCQAIRDCPVPVICRMEATRWAPGWKWRPPATCASPPTTPSSACSRSRSACRRSSRRRCCRG